VDGNGDWPPKKSRTPRKKDNKTSGAKSYSLKQKEMILRGQTLI